jgi:predicted molibdopterin-dependent oxidoreductase YjgC
VRIALFVTCLGDTLYPETGRAPQLQEAAPEVWVEMSPSDAADRGLAEGDLLRVTTPRGEVSARLRISGIRPGVLFLPFHYGYWDQASSREHDRAANELTLTDWDPASKQPIFKTAAAQAELIEAAGGRPSAAPTTGASRPASPVVPPTAGGDHALALEATFDSEPWTGGGDAS